MDKGYDANISVGDYLFGWKGDALQKAMDGKCSGDRCAPLKRQTDAQAIACTKSQQAKEDIGDQCELSPTNLLGWHFESG